MTRGFRSAIHSPSHPDEPTTEHLFQLLELSRVGVSLLLTRVQLLAQRLHLRRQDFLRAGWGKASDRGMTKGMTTDLVGPQLGFVCFIFVFEQIELHRQLILLSSEEGEG
jgi:hypothetical protein